MTIKILAHFGIVDFCLGAWSYLAEFLVLVFSILFLYTYVLLPMFC